MRQRIKDWFSDTTLKAKFLVFFLIGVIATLLAIIVSNEPWRGILGNFAVTFLAVTLIQILWDWLGGDPLEEKLNDIQNSIPKQANPIELNGIDRIWPERKKWQEDKDSGLDKWHKRVSEARKVDIVSNAFYESWLRKDDFVKDFFENIENGAEVRLLIYKPDSPAQVLRVEDESDTKDGPRRTLLRDEIVSSLHVLQSEIKKMSASAQQRLEIRLSGKSLHHAQQIRADNRMVVALYLSGKRGSPSLTIQLRDGPESKVFKNYADQFEVLWKRAVPVDWSNVGRQDESN